MKYMPADVVAAKTTLSEDIANHPWFNDDNEGETWQKGHLNQGAMIMREKPGKKDI